MVKSEVKCLWQRFPGGALSDLLVGGWSLKA